jgi:3-dehydroquinate synthase
LKKHEIQTSSGDCQVIIGESIQNLTKYVDKTKNVVITDSNVRHFQGGHFPDYDCIEIGPGEKNKTLETVTGIYKRFLELELDRSSFVIGIGGGIVCDVAGFAASTYMRGIDFGFVPTSLLAQVDASIGGKNGVNFSAYKNMVGVFKQPRFVLSDPEVLRTLPEKELLCGLAEVVKHAVIRSPALFDFLEQEWLSLLCLQRKALEKIIEDSVVIKSWIVQSDVLERGERRKLNFGHTLGHAIEREGQLSHGEAISIGMVLASRISAARGKLSAAEADHITALLKNLKLPTEVKPNKELLLEAVKKDKKRHSDLIHFVLLTEIGNAEVVPMSYSELEEHIHDLC